MNTTAPMKLGSSCVKALYPSNSIWSFPFSPYQIIAQMWATSKQRFGKEQKGILPKLNSIV